MSIKGYKVFNPDWTCRGMKYEVGQTYKHDGPISICKAGFHFCRKVADCFSYYSFDPQNKVAEVEATGLVESDNIKSVTDEIKILREIPWAEMLELANEGKGNTGIRNTGFFSTLTPTIDLFEKPGGMTYEQVQEIPGIRVLNWTYENNWWIYSKNMTDKEKAAHPEHETLGGYLKSIPFKDACALMWKNLSEDDKRKVREIPNFDADIFYRITGIRAGGQDDERAT